MKKIQGGTLYVVATPIGNEDDISLRAIKVLKLCDTVVCEEGKMGARLLHQLRLTKPIEELNEHNEEEQTPRLVAMLAEGKTLALVSDAGTPLLADPGLELVRQAVRREIAVVAVPGASSIMTALVTSGLPVHQFLFGGFLPREPHDRLKELESLAQEARTVVLLETPYRLQPLLTAAARVMPSRRAYLGCNLTMPSETHHYGTVAELAQKFTENKFKGEFVFIFAGREAGERPVRRSSGDAARWKPAGGGTSRPPFRSAERRPGGKPGARRSAPGDRKSEEPGAETRPFRKKTERGDFGRPGGGRPGGRPGGGKPGGGKRTPGGRPGGGNSGGKRSPNRPGRKG